MVSIRMPRTKGIILPVWYMLWCSLGSLQSSAQLVLAITNVKYRVNKPPTRVKIPAITLLMLYQFCSANVQEKGKLQKSRQKFLFGPAPKAFCPPFLLQKRIAANEEPFIKAAHRFTYQQPTRLVQELLSNYFSKIFLLIEMDVQVWGKGVCHEKR